MLFSSIVPLFFPLMRIVSQRTDDLRLPIEQVPSRSGC
jgi:hypothetical protein